MNLSKLALLLLFLLMALPSMAQRMHIIHADAASVLNGKEVASLADDLQTQGFRTFYNKKDIPAGIIKQLRYLAKGKLSIANPGEAYQCCCTSSEKLPQRRLLFFALSKDYFVIAYLTGGIGVSVNTHIFRLSNGQFTDMWYASGFADIKTIDELLQFMRSSRKTAWLHGITYI